MNTPSLSLRPLGKTGIDISPVTLGTVKWGRNQGLKFADFELPDDATLHALLDIAAGAGVNHLDTAPAYGISEERVGKLLAERSDGGDFLITTKAGENFADGESTYDFSAKGLRESVERSLKRLRREALDIVMVHSFQDDLHVIEKTPALETFALLKEEGKVRATGFSTMTIEGGMLAVERCDVLMVPYNLSYQLHRPVIDRAAELGKGVIIKRGLFSGGSFGAGDLEKLVQAVFEVPGATSLAVGTISPAHLRDDIDAVSEVF